MEELTMDQIRREELEADAIDAMMFARESERMEAAGYEKCKVCDCYVLDTTCGVCESCIDEIIADTTLEEIFDYASTLDEKDELALYTEYLFTREDVIYLLKDYARKTPNNKIIFKKGIKEYIENDVSHYLDYLEEKGDL